MGGSEVRAGDAVTVEAVPTESGMSGLITPEGSEMPYITAEISYGNDDPEKDDAHRNYIPENFSQMSGRLEHIPYYLNCFVCGVERSMPGLKRQFHLWESPQGNIVCAFSGFNAEDGETIHRFNRNGCLHPVTTFAVLDETMGCGAVMRDDGTFEVVAVSSGQWYAVRALTEQMRNELIPKEQNERIFAIAETRGDR